MLIRLLVQTAVFLATAALGLLVTAAALPGFRFSWSGFTIVVVVFAVAQTLVTAMARPLARKHAPALVAGVGLVSSFLALLVASAFTGLSVDGVVTWVLATLIVWLVTSVAAWMLPKLTTRDRGRA